MLLATLAGQTREMLRKASLFSVKSKEVKRKDLKRAGGRSGMGRHFNGKGGEEKQLKASIKVLRFIFVRDIDYIYVICSCCDTNPMFARKMSALYLNYDTAEFYVSSNAFQELESLRNSE